ncbi:sterol O-acyltransferase 1-like [Solenopsis invicta]|uniref:sterol O-acyltransferase 1-like n=1 Tax=Solenopsis invicta TaxID=13686 RepID=UPI00193E062C|nr:sterol O-acyltransferase 1-like [Solenopsis invicta]
MANEDVSMDILREPTTDAMQRTIQKNNDDPMSDVLQRIEAPSLSNDEFLHSTNKRESSKKDGLSDKEIFSVVCDIIEYGTIHHGINALRVSFVNFPTCIYIWLSMQTSTLCVYVAFTLWANQRLRFLPEACTQKFWDYGWLSVFILYQVLFFIIPVTMIINTNLSIGCSCIIMLEQIRMVMKSWAFVRSAAPRYLSYESHSETSRPSGPKFSQYLYFLFAPTLLYRDEYPRATEIRWMMVFWNFFEFGLSIFYEALIFDRVVVPIYHVFGTQYLEPKWFIKIVLESCIFILSLFFVVQYLIFQAWMNAWAEMLRFADRLFYKDWWNAKTINEYFRKWNLIVHIWLYTYIYKEVYKFGASQNRTLAATAVFFISAIVHEYALAFTMGFFYPVTFILFFGIGVPLFIVSKSKVVTSNFFLWILFNIDAMIMFNSYSMELNARWNNCPPHPNYYLDLLIPRSWSCQQQFNPLFTSTVKSCNETMDFSVTNY